MKRILLVCVILLCAITLLQARDIFVRQGSAGAGTRENPCGELWKAFDTALRGDVIHITEGRYFGRGGAGAFIVTVPKLTVADGLVLDSTSRNRYHKNGDLNPKDSWNGALFKASSPDIRLRNCVFLNPYNEIDNCFFINTFYNAISTRSAQKDAVIRIRNNTIAFVREQPGKGGGSAVFIGLQGKTIIENNLIVFAEEFAVFNGFGNRDTEMRDNVFSQCRQGYYKYLDAQGRNLVVWKEAELKDLNQSPEFYRLLKAGGNTQAAVPLKPDRDFFERYSNQAAVDPGSPKKNWGHAYPRERILPGLIASGLPRGVRRDVAFVVYASASGRKETPDYERVSFNAFRKDAPGVRELDGKPVEFSAGFGSNVMVWFAHIAPRADYRAVKLVLPGKDDYTRDYVYGYLLKGSEAEKTWDLHYAGRDRYRDSGIKLKGRAFYVKSESYPYPVGVIIDSLEAP